MRTFALLLIGGTAAVISTAQSTPPKQSEQPFSKPLLSLSISVPEQTVALGSEIKVKTKLTNITDHVLNLVDTNRNCDYLAEMRGDKGDSVPVTDYKRQLRCNGGLTDGRNILVTLKPQESREDEIDLTSLYLVSRVGTYSVFVQRRFPEELGGGTVQSNSITINLTD